MYCRIIIGTKGAEIAEEFNDAFEALSLLRDAPIGAVLVEEQKGNTVFIAIKKDELVYSFDESHCGEKNEDGFQDWQLTRDYGYYAIEILKHNNHLDYYVFQSENKMNEFDAYEFMGSGSYYPDDLVNGEVMLFVPKDKSMLNPNGSDRQKPRYINPEFTLENVKKHFSDVVAIF